MKKADILKVLGTVFLALAAFVFAHHVWAHGYLYDTHNLFSHEAIATFLIGMGLAFLISYLMKKR